MKLTLTDLLLVAMIAFLIFERACRVEDIDNHEQQPIVVNVYDTTQHQTIISQPQPTQTITVALPQQVDTMAVIKAYYAKNKYEETTSDSILESRYSFTIEQNRLQDFRHSYKLKQPLTTIITHPERTVYPKSFYLSGFAGYNSAGLGVVYVDKKRMYGAGYDILNKSISVQAGVKIFGFTK